MLLRWLLGTLLAVGCSEPTHKCAGAQPTKTLHEGYCQNGEAARCNYLEEQIDGF
jgi:hypothetical protein